MKTAFPAAVTSLLLVIVLPGQVTSQRSEYLYYASQGQVDDGPGLYVSGVDSSGVSGSTTLTGTRRFGSACRDNDDDQWVRSLSFDADRGRLLMMTGRKQYNDDAWFTLMSFPACHECSDNGTEIQTYFLNAQILVPQAGKLNAFLINDRRVYFIWERKQQVDTYSTQHSIELRRLTLGGRCGQLFPVTASDPFNIEDCSRLIALISRETYTENPGYQPLESLLALQTPDGSAVDIYLQLQQVTYDSSGKSQSEVAIELHHVRYSPTSADDEADIQTTVSDDQEAPEQLQTAAATAVRLHKTVLGSAIRYSLTNRGGLSATDGSMCWSTVDRVLCGRLTPSGGVTDIQTMLPNDTVAGHVCRGNDGLENVITGVTMVKAAGDEISFYFGCVAQATRMGGAGLFVGSWDDPSARTVHALRGNDSVRVGTVRAGTMFVAKAEMCDVAAVWERITGTNGVHLVAPHWSTLSSVIATILLLLISSIVRC